MTRLFKTNNRKPVIFKMNATENRSNLSSFVGGESTLGGLFAVVAGLELGQVPLVIAPHLQIKDLGFASGCRGNEVGVEQVENATADGGELGLDLGTVVANSGNVVGVAAALLLLFDGGDDPPGGAAGAGSVLIGYGEEVALLRGEFIGTRERNETLHEVHHFVVALGLLGEFRQVHNLLAGWGSRHLGENWVRSGIVCFGNEGSVKFGFYR